MTLAGNTLAKTQNTPEPRPQYPIPDALPIRPPTERTHHRPNPLNHLATPHYQDYHIATYLVKGGVVGLPPPLFTLLFSQELSEPQQQPQLLSDRSVREKVSELREEKVSNLRNPPEGFQPWWRRIFKQIVR